MPPKAVPTETQVMVKREDEQAFAELNAANPIFVEDAARLFRRGAGSRSPDRRFPRGGEPSGEPPQPRCGVGADRGRGTFADVSLDPRLFETLIHRG